LVAAPVRELVAELLVEYCSAWARTSQCHKACSQLIRQNPIDLNVVKVCLSFEVSKLTAQKENPTGRNFQLRE
jgi:hypothetical protein